MVVPWLASLRNLPTSMISKCPSTASFGVPPYEMILVIPAESLLIVPSGILTGSGTFDISNSILNLLACLLGIIIGLMISFAVEKIMIIAFPAKIPALAGPVPIQVEGDKP